MVALDECVKLFLSLLIFVGDFVDIKTAVYMKTVPGRRNRVCVSPVPVSVLF